MGSQASAASPALNHRYPPVPPSLKKKNPAKIKRHKKKNIDRKTNPMASFKVTTILVLISVCWLVLAAAKSTQDPDLMSMVHDPEMGAVDDGTVETALLNYLFAKQIMARLRTNSNPYDLIQKRSYWKQCTFNAVSCFGK